MQYCININQIKSNQIKSNQIKSNQIKSNLELYTLSNNFIKIFLIALLSFIALFSISCNDSYKPFDDIIPTTSGDLVDNSSSLYFYDFDFKRAKLEVSPETAKNIADAEVIFPAIYSNADGADLYIDNGKISVNAPNSTIKNAQCYKSGNYYNARIDNGNVKSYIKLNMDGDTMTAEYIVAMTTNGMSIRATYTATLYFPPEHLI